MNHEILWQDPDKRRAVLLSLAIHLAVLFAIAVGYDPPLPEPLETFLVIDVSEPADEVVASPEPEIRITEPEPVLAAAAEVQVPQAEAAPNPAPETEVAQAEVAPDPAPGVQVTPAEVVPGPAAEALVARERTLRDPAAEVQVPQTEAVPEPDAEARVAQMDAVPEPDPGIEATRAQAVPDPGAEAEVARAETVPAPDPQARLPRLEVAPSPDPGLLVTPAEAVPAPRAETEVAQAEAVPDPAPEAHIALPDTVPEPGTHVQVAQAQPLPGPVGEARIAQAQAVPGPDAAARVAVPATVPGPGAAVRTGQVAAVPAPGGEARVVQAQAVPGPGGEARIITAQSVPGPGGEASVTPASPIPGPDPEVFVAVSLRESEPGNAFEEHRDRPLIVLLDNTDSGYPQAGLQKASLVVEVPVEGGLTRLMTVFDRIDPGQVGPIRSARPYFVELAQTMDGILVHDGGSPGALLAIGNSELPTLDAYYFGGLFSRADGRSAPYNLYSGGAALRDAVHRLDLDQTRLVTGTLYRPDDTNAVGDAVSVRFSGDYSSGFEYLQGLGLYRWFRNGEPTVDALGEAVLVHAVLIAQIATIPWPSDSAGRFHIPLSGGDATLFLRGRAVPGSWVNVRGIGVQFVDAAGKEVDLAAFKTWVMLTPSYERMVVR